MRNKERRIEKLEKELPSDNGSEGRSWTWLDVPPALVDVIEQTYELEKEYGLWEGDPREAAMAEVEVEVRQRPDEFHLPEPGHGHDIDEEERQFWERILREARGEADEPRGRGRK